LRNEAEDARSPSEPLAVAGRTLFLTSGCSACHTIRGVAERGDVGPDLTHVGGRHSLAAGIMANTPESMARWLDATHAIKPGVQMPTYDMISSEERRAIAAYLASLR
jgi:cytochrome c oxidase subunit 2